MSAGSFSMKFPGSNQFFSVNPDGGIVIDAGSAPITMKGSSLKKTFTDAAQTDTIKGGYTQKVGGIHSMEVGSSSFAAKGSVGITAGGALNVLTTGNITETIVNASIPPAAAARETLALFGDINFNSAVGSVNLDCGRIPIAPGGTGLLSSFQMTPAGTISLKSLVALATIEMSGAGIDLKYLGGLASISLGPSGIELSYGASSIKLGPVGVTIEGVLINSSASGINTVEGSLVKLN